MSIKNKSEGTGAFARWLLATSSLVAFSAAAATPAQAFPPCAVFNNTGSTASITVSNTIATGNGCNTGTVSPGGIAITNSTINGSILDSGTIAGGIFVDANSQINSIISAPGSIAVNGSGSSFAGGILNAGTLSSFNATIAVDGLASFSGGISNRGTVNAGLSGTQFGCAFGVQVENVASFAGGITNSGTLNVGAAAPFFGCNSSSVGIEVSGVSSFSGGIGNSGTINATTSIIPINCNAASAFAAGIDVSGVSGVSSFSGGIRNSGAINVAATATSASGSNCGSVSASAYGINVSGVATFSGGIGNSGTITASATASTSAGGCGQALAYGISVGDCGCSPSTSTFADGISNGGTITATATGLGCASAVATGINVDNLLGFSGGISNGGTIAATASVMNGSGLSCAVGIRVANVANYAGGINNGGTITATATNLACGAAHAVGISVTNVTNFSGDIVNGGAITATTIAGAGSCGIGIFIDNISTFTGRIVNSGTIIGGVGIVVGSNTPGISIFSSGTITGTNGAAIDFQNAGGNTLTLGPGFVMNGSVIAQNGSNTFQLGGTGNGSFDLGALGTQYLGFDTFNVRSATWTVTGVYGNGLTSPWNVQGGTFLVDGDLTAATGVNVTGGALGGTGLLPDTVINSGGTLMPGLPDTPGGLLTIATGNLTMNSGSFYLVNVGTGTTGFTSLTNVANGGTASLDPGSLLGVAGSGAYTQGAKYTVLTATGGVIGTFSNPGNVALGHLGSMLANITYDANDVFLNLTPASLLSFLPAGTTINAINVANGINTANVGTPPVQFQNLFNLPPQQLGAALLQLSGEVGTGTQESGLQLMNSFISLLSNPFGGNQGGTGPMMAFAPERETFSPEIAEAYASALNDKAVLKAPGMPAPRYSYWGKSYGGTNATAGDPTVVGSHDVSTRALGFAAGVDVRTAPGQVVGFSLGGANTTWGLSNNFGNGRSEAFQAGIYGSQQLGPAYVSGVGSPGTELEFAL